MLDLGPGSFQLRGAQQRRSPDRADGPGAWRVAGDGLEHGAGCRCRRNQIGNLGTWRAPARFSGIAVIDARGDVPGAETRARTGDRQYRSPPAATGLPWAGIDAASSVAGAEPAAGPTGRRR